VEAFPALLQGDGPAPDEAFMALELVPGALIGISGMVKYPRRSVK
jgi:predicted N-acetyltransferase YhbS